MVGVKNILVTGASSGIGLALCKRLTTEHGCFVYLGSRNPTKGDQAKRSIVEQFPDVANQIEVLEIDVGKDDSVKAAAETLTNKGVQLYALVNNAGVGLAHGVGTDEILNVNYHGPQRVTQAMVPLIDDKEGRIVNTSSGAASMWVRDQNDATKAFYSNPPASVEQLDESVRNMVAAGNLGFGDGYALSKAALTALTIVQAKLYPQFKVVSLSPGFIATPMTQGYGARLTPEQGCTAFLKCLFDDNVTSGYYYGSDGLRSPLTCTRDPGTPEYGGEPNPDPARYNK